MVMPVLSQVIGNWSVPKFAYCYFSDRIDKAKGENLWSQLSQTH